MCDDVFTEDEDRVIPEDNEWNRLQKSRLVDGFRDGLAVGEEENLQRGFNKGYKSSMKIAFDLAKLRGCISAIIGMNITTKNMISEETGTRLEDLLVHVIDLERDIVAQKMEATNEIEKETNGETENLSRTKPCSEETGCCGGGKCDDKQEHLTQIPASTGNINSVEFYDDRLLSLHRNFREIIQGSGIEKFL